MSFIATFAERCESAIRKALPYSLMAFLLLLNSVSAPYMTAGGAKAPFFLMGLYYWSIYRPTLIPPWLAFVAGITADLLGGGPLGLNAGAYVLAQWIVSDQRRFLMGQSFMMMWFGFFILSAFTGLLQWAVYGLVNLGWPSLKLLGVSEILGVALFPLVCVALHWTHKALPTPARRLEPR